MTREEQYTKDLQFIERTDRLLSRNIEFAAYFFALFACAVAHLLYLVLFYVAGVRMMALFNVFSVTFYLVTVFLVRKVKDKLRLIYASIAEILIHSALATICVGLGPNFCMFMLMVITLAFLMPNKNVNAPFVVLFIAVPLYGFLNFYYSDSRHVPYDLSGTPIEITFYVINIIVGAFVLIYVAIIYTHMNRYMECKLRVQHEQMRLMATTDPLTGLSNRRAVNHKMSELINSGIKKYVIAIGDIDDFKKVNDTYGHEKGDIVLQEVSAVIGSNIPGNGCAARWGGEEFLIFIPDADIEEGRKCTDNIISLIRQKTFSSDGVSFSVTMTVGVCEGSSDSNIDNIIKIADDRLYRGKHNGKNHTEYTDELKDIVVPD